MKGSHAPAWMVTFADLALLLMAFFVLMMSFSSVDLAKYRNVSESMSEAFNDALGAFDQPLAGRIGKEKADSDTFNKEAGNAASQIGESDDETRQKMEETFSTLKSVLRKEVTEGKVSVESSGNSVIIRFDDSAYFTAGSEGLSPAMAPVLQRVATVLLDSPGTIVVEGHTDSQPISTERFRSNWDLSTARAASVVTELLQFAPIANDRVVVQGHSDTKPVAPNDTAANRAKNRRVEIHIISDNGQTTTLSVPTQ
ncbi:MAG: type VI secretion system protein TssL [Alphaproteobacteria bacterium]|nr:type VI secretion system protein TssL [Alphaproteobacteria bacterium]